MGIAYRIKTASLFDEHCLQAQRSSQVLARGESRRGLVAKRCSKNDSVKVSNGFTSVALRAFNVSAYCALKD